VSLTPSERKEKGGGTIRQTRTALNTEKRFRRRKERKSIKRAGHEGGKSHMVYYEGLKETVQRDRRRGSDRGMNPGGWGRVKKHLKENRAVDS